MCGGGTLSQDPQEYNSSLDVSSYDADLIAFLL